MSEIVTVRIKRKRTAADPQPERPILSRSTSTSPDTVTTLTLCSEAKATRDHKKHEQREIINVAALMLARAANKAKTRQRDDKLERESLSGVDLPAADMPGAPKNYQDAKRTLSEIRQQAVNPQPFDPSPLSRLWPVFAFPANPYPLSREAIKAVKLAAYDRKEPEIRQALAQWLTQSAYLAAVSRGGKAFDLQAMPDGDIHQHDRDRANWRRVAFSVILKQHRRATRVSR